MNVAPVQASATRTRAKARTITVAEYLSEQIRLCGKTQVEIAHEAGFNRANMISMLKHGEAKLPISKVGTIAKALGVDATYLFSLVMREYEPQTWAAIEEGILRQPVLSQNEIEIIDLIRTGKVANPKIRTVEDERRILDAVGALKPENATAD